jgi:hypothetical protein
MFYREDEARRILREVDMAYGVDCSIRRGLDDGGEYRDDPEYEYNADLGYSERIRSAHPIDDNIEATNEAVDDE